MMEHNTNPIYSFLNECFINENYKEYFEDNEVKIHKKTKKFYIPSDIFFQCYKYFLSAEDKGFIKPSYKIIRAILNDIGINKKKIQMDGVRKEYYEIDSEELKDQLDEMNLIEAVEEFDENDFE